MRISAFYGILKLVYKMLFAVSGGKVGLKKEAGVNPAQSRCCIWGQRRINVTGSDPGKARPSMIHKSEDLP